MSLGPGGVGKTRLAHRAVDELAHSFADGAAFVPLDDLSTSDELGGRIAHELDIALKGHEEPMEQVIAALRERHMLLVLDNFEHLVDGRTASRAAAGDLPAPEAAGDVARAAGAGERVAAAARRTAVPRRRGP